MTIGNASANTADASKAIRAAKLGDDHGTIARDAAGRVVWSRPGHQYGMPELKQGIDAIFAASPAKPTRTGGDDENSPCKAAFLDATIAGEGEGAAIEELKSPGPDAKPALIYFFKSVDDPAKDARDGTVKDCFEMEAGCLADDEVGKLAGEFAPLRIDVRARSAKALLDRFKVSRAPALVVLARDGVTVVGKLTDPGAKPKALIQLLKKARS